MILDMVLEQLKQTHNDSGISISVSFNESTPVSFRTTFLEKLLQDIHFFPLVEVFWCVAINKGECMRKIWKKM